MRVVRLVFPFILMFGIPQHLLSQQPTASVQRDPQALSILLQSLSAAGGAASVAAIQDFTGTGTINYNWAGQAVSGSVTVYGEGLDEFRMDTSVSSGNRSLVVNGMAASLTSTDGKKTKLSIYGVMTAGALTLPVVRIADVLNDPTTSVRSFGLVSWNGVGVYQVHVLPTLDPGLSVAPSLSGLGEFDLYFDPTSFQLLGLAEKVWWGNNLQQSYVHELLFSDYTQVNGLSVPFTTTERFGGQQTWTMTLSSLTLNTGVADSLFKL